MDGVLADTERDAHRPAFNKAFERYHLDTQWTAERYGKLLETGGGKERMTAHWNEVGWPEGFPEDPEERQAKVKELHLRKTAIFNEMIQEGGIPLRPGVLRVIDDAIAANLRLAVCSTSSELAVRNLVKTLMGPDRAAMFEIFAGDMVKKKKPSPDVYLMAVDKMGLDKSKCVIVEDSHIGLGAALAAGITCIVTKSSYTANEDFTGADMVVDELGDDPATGVTLETLESLLQKHAEIGGEIMEMERVESTLTELDPSELQVLPPSDPSESEFDVVELAAVPLDDPVEASVDLPTEKTDALEQQQDQVGSVPMESMRSEIESSEPTNHGEQDEAPADIDGTIGFSSADMDELKEREDLVEPFPLESSPLVLEGLREPTPKIAISEPVQASIELAIPTESQTLTEVARIVKELAPPQAKRNLRWKTYVFWSYAHLYDQTFGG
jgi:HAD superfamily hydrolase (TIGR01509 family)